MSIKWRKVFLEILKYSISAILGAAGISLTGCAFIPIL